MKHKKGILVRSDFRIAGLSYKNLKVQIEEVIQKLTTDQNTHPDFGSESKSLLHSNYTLHTSTAIGRFTNI